MPRPVLLASWSERPTIGQVVSSPVHAIFPNSYVAVDGEIMPFGAVRYMGPADRMTCVSCREILGIQSEVKESAA